MPNDSPLGCIASVMFDSYLRGVAFHDDDRVVVSEDGLHFVDLVRGGVDTTAECPGAGVAITADGTVVGADGLFDGRGKRLATFDELLDDLLAVSSDGRWLARVRDEEGIVVEELVDRVAVMSIDTGDSVDSAAFLPDGRLVVARERKPLTIADPADGRVVSLSKTALRGYPRAVVPSPDGRWVVDLPGHKKECVIRSTADGSEVATLRRGRTIRAAAWFADGRHLALAELSAISVIDATTWQPVGELRLGPRRAAHIAVSPSGKRVAVVSLGEPHELSVWDVGAIAGSAPRARARKPASPPLKGVFFAVDASRPLVELRRAARGLHHILDNQPDHFVLVVERDGEAVDGRRWFTFLASRGRTWRREPWVECLTGALGSLVVACVDERARMVRIEPAGGPDPVPRLKALRDRGDRIAVVLGGTRVDSDTAAPQLDPALAASLVPRTSVSLLDL